MRRIWRALMEQWSRPRGTDELRVMACYLVSLTSPWQG
jgi:hypothetical protein